MFRQEFFWKSFRLFPAFILEFSGLFYYLIIKVVRWLFASACYILPHLFALVNNFFIFFEFLFCRRFLLCGSEIHITTLSSLCQHLFSIFLKFFSVVIFLFCATAEPILSCKLLFVNTFFGISFKFGYDSLLFTANRSRISIKNLFPLYVFYNVQHEKTDSYIYFL